MDEPVKDFYGRVIGYLETKPNGDRVAKDFYKKILGRYIKNTNKTTNFVGQVLYDGDMTSALIFENNAKKEN